MNVRLKLCLIIGISISLLLVPTVFAEPEIILNSPNSGMYYYFGDTNVSIILDSTAINNDLNPMCVDIFGSNSSSPSSDNLLYQKCNVLNNTNIIYNWTSPVINNDYFDLTNNVLIMHFDNRSEFGENDTYINDFSGNGFHGNVTGSPLFNMASGKIAGMVDLDGTSDYIESSTGDFDQNANFTIAFWFNADQWNGAPSVDSSIISKTDDTDGWFIGDRSELGGVMRFASNHGNIKTTTTFTTGRWYHIVAVMKDLNTAEIWVNGQLDASGDNGWVTHDSAPLRIGNDAPGTNREFNGKIDELAIWNRSLSTTEIKDLYRLRNGTYYWSVNVSDGINETQSEIRLFNINLLNTVPKHTTPILNSTYGTNYTTENLTCYNQSTSDIDGDPVKNIFNWYVDGSSLPSLNMPFEGGSNSTYTKDYTNLSNGENVNGSTWSSTGGYDGFGAYEFDGVDDSIYIGNNSALVGTNVTITAWVYWNGSAGSYDPIVTQSDGAFLGYYLYINSAGGTKYLGFWLDDTDAVTTSNFPQNEWHFVVGVHNDTHLSVYIDGNLGGSAAKTGSGLNKTGYIGFDNVSDYFNGTIDDVMIFDKALSIEQINAIYNNRTDLIVSQENSVEAQWMCEVTPNDGYNDGTTLGSNNLTIIYSVYPVIDGIIIPSSENPIEGSIRTIYIQFNATDSSGLNHSTANIALNNSGTSRTSSSCANISQSGDTVKYNCSIDLYYHDPSGTWNVNISIIDISGNYAANLSETYAYGSLAAMTMAPDSISFGTTLTLGSTDILAVDDPVVLNNTGNVDFSTITVTGYDLIGQTDNSDIIPAGNFSVNVADACNGDSLVNASAATVTSGLLNHGSEPSIENLYWCFEDVPLGINAQVYNTTGSTEWLIEVLQ